MVLGTLLQRRKIDTLQSSVFVDEMNIVLSRNNQQDATL